MAHGFSAFRFSMSSLLHATPSSVRIMSRWVCVSGLVKSGRSSPHMFRSLPVDFFISACDLLVLAGASTHEGSL